ncbi:hypothetical protein C943_01041 [Mariniradius saccharolyticus AK6]|uniref:Uncharacterized protein n=1 Tax=Mariniradius saccharolyticus AK6 TaxID=1239962 RepID=M7XDQ4_9BACT|nr:hypothetical protein C943_01041 [Mariniradius saccharolyticus AK6]
MFWYLKSQFSKVQSDLSRKASPPGIGALVLRTFVSGLRSMTG